MSKNNPYPHPEQLEAYERLVQKFEEVDRKGKSMPYTSINGHMFSFLSADGAMALRLSEPDRNKFIEVYNTDLRVERGRIMKEYVSIPSDMQMDVEKLSFYFSRSLDYVKGLKPK